ncbi:uncharacterized protein [Rutidosis leptorrhynchoides]|uniref:uncharacterized protein n=1 Tax=Rutidosis leptorrhynchoides TaxID=125765 RepID=UPI003A9910FF
MEKSIDEKLTIVPIEEEDPNWMTPLVKFLTESELLADVKEARMIHVKAPTYVLIEGILYRKSYLGPSVLCIGQNRAKEVLREVHEGYCALYSRYRTISAKVMRIGYFWPTIHNHAAEVVRECQSCRQHAPISRAPRHPMIPKMTAWPFCKWAIDIVGPITACSGGIKFLVVAIDYFTKWVERYREGNKSALGLYGNEWVDELLKVLWEHRTTHKNSTGETSFCLIYGTEAVIPTELLVPMKRIRSFNESSNDEGLRANLNMLEEPREIAAIREAVNK